MVKSLGKRLKSLREREGLSQKRAAEIFGLTNTQLSRYENDIHSPDPELLRKLSEYYHVSTDYILGVSDNPNSKGENFSTAFYDFENITEEEKEFLDEQLEIFRKFRKETLDKREKDK